MRFAKYFALTAIMIASTAGATQAAPISFSDTFNPNDVLMLNSSGTNCTGTNALLDVNDLTSASTCGTLTYSHSITPPYNPLTDTLTSAILSLYVYDDEANENSAEKLDYNIDFGALVGGTTPVNLNNIGSGAPYVESFSVLAQLTADGQLHITLTQQAVDLRFAQSILNAEGDREQDVIIDPNISPEPATLALFGLSALAAVLRRRSAA